MNFKTVLTVGLFLASTSALALQAIEGKVVWLEPTYMPALIKVSLDKGTGTCPVGTHLVWSNSNIENNKVVYSTLLAAQMSGTSVRFHYNDGDTSCTGTHLHLFSN